MELSSNAVLDQCESSGGPGMELLRKIADHFEITFEDLIDDRIDEEWIRQPQLAAKFSTQDGSKLRTSLPVIHWLEAQYGEAPIRSLLRSLRIPNHSVRNPEQTVKLKLLCMLLRSAAARGVPSQSIFEMGFNAISIPENESIRNALRDFRSPKEAYEYFFGPQGLVDRFEKNYRYRIEKLGTDSVSVSVSPLEPRIFENGPDVVYDRLVSVYRWGVAAGVLRVVGAPLVSVEPLRIASQSGSPEHFRIVWRPTRDQAPSDERTAAPFLRLL